MRVLQVLPHLNIGGITTYVYTLAKYLARKGIEAAVCSAGGSREEDFRKLGIKTYKIPIKTKNELSPKVLLAALRIIKIHKQFPYDIIHSHNRVTQVTSQLASGLGGAPHVANFHGFYQKNKKRKIRKLIKAQGKLSIAITPFVKKDLVRHFGARPDKVKTILSAIDLETLNQDAPSLNLKGNPVIGASGRLSPVKGFQYLIKSLPNLIQKYPEAQLYILGKGRFEKKLIQLAENLEVEKHLNLLKDRDLSSFLNSLDIFCLPSREEPLGLSVVEAQYIGVPVVISDVDGLNLLVDDQITGIKTKVKSPNSINQAIVKLMAEKALYRRISINAHKQVIDRFDIGKKIGSFISTYKQALDENIDS